MRSLPRQAPQQRVYFGVDYGVGGTNVVVWYHILVGLEAKLEFLHLAKRSLKMGHFQDARERTGNLQMLMVVGWFTLIQWGWCEPVVRIEVDSEDLVSHRSTRPSGGQCGSFPLIHHSNVDWCGRNIDACFPYTWSMISQRLEMFTNVRVS